MRYCGLTVLLATACSRIAGIGGEFGVVDSAGGDGPGPDARMVTQRAYIKASNPGAGDTFGERLAVSGDGSTLAIGATYEDGSARGINGVPDEAATDSGAVYVFRRTGASWVQEAYIKSSNSDPGDRFGYSLALSYDGSMLLVGAPLEDSSGTGPGGTNDNLAQDAGAAYVFVRSGTTWSQESYLKASNTQAGDELGFHVALSADGNTAAIDAVFEDSAANVINGNQSDNTASAAGAVYVLTRASGTWTQQAYIKASNMLAGHRFGYRLAVSADGNTMAVTAPYEASAATGIGGNASDTSAPDAGAAYVFTRAGITWTQQAYIKASNTGSLDQFGWTVGLSADGNTLAIGAPHEDSGATGIDGNPADDPAALDSGAAYVYARSGTTWSQQAYVKSSNTDAGDDFGVRLSLSPDGSTLVVGAVGEDSGARSIGGNQQDESAPSSGASYLLWRSGQVWAQADYLKASNTGAGDQFGYLPPSSPFAVVGASDEDSASPGIDGAETDNSLLDSGAVYVFE